MTIHSSGRDFSPYTSGLEDGEVPVFGLRITQYFNKKGDLCWKMDYSGDIHITQMLGLMDLAHAEVRDRARGVSAYLQKKKKEEEGQ